MLFISMFILFPKITACFSAATTPVAYLRKTSQAHTWLLKFHKSKQKDIKTKYFSIKIVVPIIYLIRIIKWFISV